MFVRQSLRCKCVFDIHLKRTTNLFVLERKTYEKRKLTRQYGTLSHAL